MRWNMMSGTSTTADRFPVLSSFSPSALSQIRTYHCLLVRDLAAPIAVVTRFPLYHRYVMREFQYRCALQLRCRREKNWNEAENKKKNKTTKEEEEQQENKEDDDDEWFGA